MQTGPTLNPDEFWERIETMDVQLRGSFAQRPCFGLDCWTGPRMIAEWALGDSTFRSVQYGQAGEPRQVVVATSEDDIEDPVQHIIWNLPSEEPFEERMNRLRTAQLPVVSERIEVSVSGQHVTFDVRSVDDYLVADATVDGQHIVLRTHGIGLEELNIAPIEDIEPYLEGRNALIRQARAEQGIIDPK